jgi:hypothetical protein
VAIYVGADWFGNSWKDDSFVTRNSLGMHSIILVVAILVIPLALT